MPHFYFGCEGDDPGVSWAFNGRTNPAGARLRAMFGSDISHWDVPDMTEPMAEAYEQVEDGRLSRERLPRLHVRECRTPVHEDESHSSSTAHRVKQRYANLLETSTSGC